MFPQQEKDENKNDLLSTTTFPTFSLERCRAPAVVSEDHQHGLLALVVVASRGEAHQLHVDLAAPQGLHYHLETLVVALIHHPGAYLNTNLILKHSSSTVHLNTGSLVYFVIDFFLFIYFIYIY